MTEGEKRARTKLRVIERERLERWRIDPTDGEAGGFVLDLIVQVAGRLRFAPTVTDEAVGVVVAEILAKIHAGTLPEISFPRAYLRQRLYWRCLDIIEKAKPPPPPRPRADASPPRPACPFDDPDEVALLDRAFRLAMRVRQSRHKPNLQRAWERCAQWHGGDQTMTDLVRAECAALGITAARRIRTVYDRETRAQDRLRDALRSAVDQLEERAKLSTHEAAVTSALVDRLERCPKGPSPTVQGAS